ncbi:hypothetical protein [Gracilibacillus xinjiangensis]|uniref:DUF4320 family protein n=1 Tax=Gracilibacillus xinjiangensis TaxID=1193282 RepID=A0ABV8WZ09_9BACI
MKKRAIALVIPILLGIAIFLVMDQLKYTTYEEVIAEMIHDPKDITKVIIENRRTKLEITSAELIRKLLKEPADMELKKQDKIPDFDYIVQIHTNYGEVYDVGVGKNGAHFGYAGSYTVTNDNRLFHRIDHMEWEPDNYELSAVFMRMPLS